MRTSQLTNSCNPRTLRANLIVLIIFLTSQVSGQQFNSDSWLSKPNGTITIIPTLGQRSSMLMNTFSLINKWEFTMAAYLYNNDNDPATNDGYSTSFYVKYMFYENAAQTGGAAVKVGTGTFPGTIDPEVRVKDAFKTFWMNAPVTFSLFHDKISWDLMPGSSVTINYGDNKTAAWAFTYSSRVAWYPFSPKLSFVGEVFGSAGETGTLPEFKVGPRYEPNQYAVFALTYGQEFGGNNGAGFEIGVMLFTPPFACLGGCKVKKPPVLK